MNQQVQVSTKATEAIVAEDGRVQSKINNYETTIGSHAEDRRSNLSRAVNNNYNSVNKKTTNTGKRGAKATLQRYAMYVAIALVAIGFAWSVSSFFLSTRKPLIIRDTTKTGAEAIEEHSSSELQLETIANSIIHDGKWNPARIGLFIQEWNKNSRVEKDTYRTEIWYRHFRYRLQQKIRYEQSIGVFPPDGNSSSAHPLMELASALEISKSSATQGEVHLGKKAFSDLDAEDEQTLAFFEAIKPRELQTNTGKAAVAVAAARGGELLETAKPATIQSSSIGERTAADDKSSAVTGGEQPINDADIKRVLDQYATAYARGDMQQMASLFGGEDPEHGKQIIAELKNNYELLFANSNKRDVNFDGLNWRVTGNRAEVRSNYRAAIELKHNKGTQLVTANVKLEMQLLNNDLKIGRLELLDRKVNVLTPELNLASSGKSAKSDVPTAAELQDVVARLIGAYENGDVKVLASLFAKDAKTNDRNGLKDIEADYSRLFANSSERQMFIQNMAWSRDKNAAKLSGDLAAIVFARGGEPFYSMQGKIQIVAKRVGNKVLITHLYHKASPE
ncbi:MAG TPA: nuclear transport factor 2 family protein [Gammaproteobacteria bacterium]